MKKLAIFTLALAMAAAGAQARSSKRGIAENQFQMEGQMSPLEPGVCWYYNWGNKPGVGYQSEVQNFTGFEFVPMCWNGVNADAIRAHCAEHPECKYILGFNEPNFKDQANLTPSQAAAKWPELVNLAHELNLQIVAPALNYSPDAPYQNPVTWMNEFVALVGLDAFDYTALHCYGGLGVLQDLATQFHNNYGKPVWVTEFCFWPGGAGNVYVSPTAQLASLINTCEWLEKTEWIYRYSWFKAIGDHNATNKPNYGLLITSSGHNTKELSPQGWAYVYMTDFNPDVWNRPGDLVAATEYIASSGILIGKGANPDCPRPIELTQFNADAHADYQFDIPSAGSYTLRLTVSGIGEPVRFDPSIAVKAINADGTEGATLAETGTFAISGSDEVYTTVDINIELPAGHQTLRLADANQYRPSGIHISTLQLVDRSGIESVAADIPQNILYYDLNGRPVDPNRLQRGIYITSDGRKVVKN